MSSRLSNEISLFSNDSMSSQRDLVLDIDELLERHPRKFAFCCFYDGIRNDSNERVESERRNNRGEDKNFSLQSGDSNLTSSTSILPKQASNKTNEM